MIILYILLFVFCLSVLIAIHELGHLATAKIFKVYCFEYALGFGPKLFSKKRKDGETYFSIRAIPFGGFVSMYGESETVPEGLEIDPSRSLLAIKKWKRAIIMAAGVIMNFLLALVIFFVYELAFPVYTPHYAHIAVSQDSPLVSELHTGDLVYASVYQDDSNSYIFYNDSATLYYGSNEVKVFFGYNYGTLTIKDTSIGNRALAFEKKDLGNISLTYTDTDFATVFSTDYPEGVEVNEGLTGYISGIKFYNGDSYRVDLELTDAFSSKSNNYVLAELSLTLEQFENFKKVPYNSEIKVVGDLVDRDSRKVMVVKEFKTTCPDIAKSNLFSTSYEGYGLPDKLGLSMFKQDKVTPVGKGVETSVFDIALTKESNASVLPSNFGLYMQLDKTFNGFGHAVKYTFVDFGEASTAIIRGLGDLITTKDGWKNIGGIIQIGVVSTQILQQSGFGKFLMLWGLISVNLGIVNLLPFPGLDGWHLLVIAVEGIFRKEIPSKVKNLIAAIGVIILFVLMILIVIKDIIGLF